MRLSSTSFTHGSTAVFAFAVVGYAALRVVAHGAPHLPGPQAAPVAPPVQQVHTVADLRDRPRVVVGRPPHRRADVAPASDPAPARPAVSPRPDKRDQQEVGEAVDQPAVDVSDELRPDDHSGHDDSAADVTERSTDDEAADDRDDD
jgi:type IV secretory pathway VirB10-like protein